MIRHRPVPGLAPRGPQHAARRVRIPEAEIAPADAPLGELLGFWRDQITLGRQLPNSATGFDLPLLLSHLKLNGWAHVLDVSADDPANFRWRLFGSHCSPMFNGVDLTDRTVGSIPSPTIRAQLLADYNAVKLTGQPSYHLVKARVDWRDSEYSRLTLAIGDDAGAPSLLLIAVNKRALPELRGI